MTPFTTRSINKKQYIKRSLSTIIQLNSMLGHLKKEHAMKLGYQHKILGVVVVVVIHCVIQTQKQLLDMSCKTKK
ncbi:hypothetical protein BpHYR1_024675 [Brachionus plicatilis]|uniref:Uncharacterized protein n=1 Tax=Brachionus plicatilis TaxID=10195 RepID=A0A3M7RN20_BRAPC|nr:hypothetical protein BpHYR1_024675 [Brachionus plicatilis]